MKFIIIFTLAASNITANTPVYIDKTQVSAVSTSFYFNNWSQQVPCTNITLKSGSNFCVLENQHQVMEKLK